MIFTKFLNDFRYWDYYFYRLIHGSIHNHPGLNEFYLFFAKYGIIFFVLSFIYLIWRRKIIAFICTFVAMAIALAVDFAINLFWTRPRPFISHSGEIMMPIVAGLRVYAPSFPSAHTYIVFAIATSVYLFGHRRLGTLLYILAILVALGRVGAGLHYPSDVLAGAGLGIVSGIIAETIVKKNRHKWDISEADKSSL